MSVRNSQFPDPIINVDPGSLYTTNNRFAIEREFIDNYGNCDTEILKQVTDEAGSIVPVNFHSLFMQKDLTDSTQKAISCIINGLKANPDDPYLNALLKEFKLIGDGTFGEVYLTYGDFGPLFMIKSIKRENVTSDMESLVHEAFVGMSAINTLRKEIPHFIHTYGVIECGGKQGALLTKRNWCQRGTPEAVYVAIEPVSAAESLVKVISEDIDLHHFAKIIIQIESALGLASDRFGFTHYDLHDSNVLVQEFGNDIYVPIYYDGVMKYMKTRFLPRIIDYGLSYVQFGKEKFGFVEEGVFRYLRSYPIRDSVTLLMCCFDDLYRKIRSGKGTDNTDDCIRFIREIYPATGGEVDEDYPLFGQDVGAVKTGTNMIGNGEMRWNEQRASFSHEDVLRQIRDVLTPDIFDDLLVSELPPGANVYNANSRSWFAYEGLLFDRDQIAEEEAQEIEERLELKLDSEIAEEAQQFLQEKRSSLAAETIDRVLRKSTASSDSDDEIETFSSPEVMVEEPAKRQLLESPKPLLEPVVLGTVDRTPASSESRKTIVEKRVQESVPEPPIKLTFSNPDPFEDGNDPNEREIEKRSEEEIRALQKTHNCPARVRADIINNLGSLNMNAFTSLFELGQPNPDQQLQNVIGCLIEAMGDLGERGFDPIISSLNLIAAGTYGEVLLANKEDRPLFIVKRSKEGGSLTHEAFVGMMAINKIRSITPAFVYTYGLFGCKKMSQTGEKTYSWCDKPDSHDEFLFIENLASTQSLYNYTVSDAFNYLELTKIILQVVSALNVAYKTFGFTHYDLHGSNVLIQTLPEVVTVPIHIENEVFYLETQNLVRIIDYGGSRIKLPNGKSYGDENYGMASSFHGYPVADLSVFLNSIFVNLRKRNLAIPENKRMYDLITQLYDSMLGRDIEEDFIETFEKTRWEMDEKYDMIRNFDEAIEYYSDDLAKLQNFLVARDNPSLDTKLAELHQFIQQTPYLQGLTEDGSIDRAFAGSGMPATDYNFMRFMVEKLSESIEDEIDILQRTRPSKSADVETSVFHNGYVVYRKEYANITHDNFFEMLVGIMGEDTIIHVLNKDPNPKAKRTICTYDCKSWDKYRNELFA